MINFKLKTLKNGIRLITAPLEQTEVTTIEILVGTGARFDPLDKSGISHFLEHMFFKGSTSYPSFAEVTQLFDSIGAGFNASTSYEAIRFYIQTCSVDFRKGYDVLKDIFKHPLFQEEYMELERGVILEEIKMYKDMPQAWVGILNQGQTFPAHQLGADIGGTSKTVSSISREDLVGNWKSHYSPETMIIALSGNLEDNGLAEMVERDFESIAKLDSKKFTPFNEKQYSPSVKQEVRPIDQANFVISFPAFKKSDKRRFAQTILDLILGASPSSRLYSEIREKRGLAYDVGSGINAYFDTGTHYLYGGVKSEKMEDVYKLVLDELEKLKKDGVTPAELERAKGNLRGTITRSLESSHSIANYLISSLYWQKEIMQVEELLETYNAVSAEQVKDLAGQIFDCDKAIVSIVGPKEYKL